MSAGYNVSLKADTVPQWGADAIERQLAHIESNDVRRAYVLSDFAAKPQQNAGFALSSNTTLIDISPPASQAANSCWICGGPANSGEHKTKRSDLKAVFGKPTQVEPIFYHDNSRKNRPVKSLDAKFLKSPDRICQYCNNARTQPHDLAWERLSAFIMDNSHVTPGTLLRANRVFPYDACQQMLNVHLFFAKVFGCLILEGNLGIDVTGFSKAILETRAHPDMYLKFGRPAQEERITVGRSDVWAWPPTTQASVRFATWFYSLPHLWVNVMFAMPGQQREGLLGAWHPSRASKRLSIADFRYADELMEAKEASHGP